MLALVYTNQLVPIIAASPRNDYPLGPAFWVQVLLRKKDFFSRHKHSGLLSGVNTMTNPVLVFSVD